MKRQHPSPDGTAGLLRILLVAGVLFGIGYASIPFGRHDPAQRVPAGPAAVSAAPGDSRVLPGANAPLSAHASEPEVQAPTF